ncbi:MAG: sulfite exporter TauE/SafE family protein [Bacteroidota bacterium]
MFDQALLLATFAALILGFTKSGFKGLSFIVVALMAKAFESKASTGILLPLLIAGDILAIIYYRKDVDWKVLFRLFPSIAVGVIIGVFVGDRLSSEVFKRVMAAIIIGSGILLVWMDRRESEKVPNDWVFAASMGLTAGFCTMVGNLAGPIANIYFLAMKFPKKRFIGTAAWLFFIVNTFKLPFHICVWKTISLQSVQGSYWMIPIVAIGFAIGIKLIEKVSENIFKKYIIVITLLGAILILL